MSKCDVINLVCEALSKGQLDESKEIIKEKYPFDMVETKQWNCSKAKLLQIFVRDGFIDRYSGEKLVFPGALRILSELMPKEFPYQEHWKMSECHIAWWQLFPTIDHKVPIARGGSNDNENLVCTSMLRNIAKGNSSAVIMDKKFYFKFCLYSRKAEEFGVLSSFHDKGLGYSW